MLISVSNLLDSLPTTQYSYLTANVNSAGTIFPVRNINPFSASHAIQIGKTGEARSEILILGTAAPASGTINTTAAGVYSHALDSLVFDIHYDKVIFKRSTSGTAGTATAFATVTITPNSQFTEYNDSVGAATYAYKTAFYNSVTSDTSSDSDWFVPGGPTFYSLQSMRGRVKDRLYNSNFLKDDAVVNDWINEWLEELNTAAVKVNKDYLMGTTSFSVGTAGLGTVTVTDFMYPRKIEVTWDGVNWTQTSQININSFSDSDVFSSDDPKHSWTGDTTLQFLPNGSLGTARMTYSRGEPILNSDSDELPYPMRRYTRSFINYALACAYENNQNEEWADRNSGKAKAIKMDFINEITPRDQTGPHAIEITEELSANDGFDLDGNYI